MVMPAMSAQIVMPAMSVHDSMDYAAANDNDNLDDVETCSAADDDVDT